MSLLLYNIAEKPHSSLAYTLISRLPVSATQRLQSEQTRWEKSQREDMLFPLEMGTV